MLGFGLGLLEGGGFAICGLGKGDGWVVLFQESVGVDVNV